MLAVSKDGERARGWLQTQLWSTRNQKEANNSLRRELSELRKRLNASSYTLLICERDRVRLDLSMVSIDIFESDDEPGTRSLGQPGEFLEGFDLPGEENFDDWLRVQRQNLVRLTGESPVRSSVVADRQAVIGSPPLSVVLLPFTNISGDPDQEYFVDGVTESLTTDLSRIVGLFVIGRNTAFTYKSRAFDLKQVGRELGVRYVLQGSVQRRGDRLNVQLAGAETGAQLWAERFDKRIADLFEVQDEIISRIANQLEAQLIEAEAKRSKRSQNPNSMELYFQGRALLNRGWTPDYLDQARNSFENALILDPKNIEAMVGVAIVDLAIGSTYLSDNLMAQRARSLSTITKVLSLAPNHALAHLILGAALIATNRPAEGIAECERALAIDRNLAEAHAQIGLAKQTLGRSAETWAHVNEAFRLSPLDSHAYRWLMFNGISKLALGEYAEAAIWLRRSIESNRNIPLAHFYLAVALALLGSLDQASAAAEAGLSIDPSFTLRRFRDNAQSDHPTYLAQRERTCEGMRIAGIPEG